MVAFDVPIPDFKHKRILRLWRIEPIRDSAVPTPDDDAVAFSKRDSEHKLTQVLLSSQATSADMILNNDLDETLEPFKLTVSHATESLLCLEMMRQLIDNLDVEYDKA